MSLQLCSVPELSELPVLADTGLGLLCAVLGASIAYSNHLAGTGMELISLLRRPRVPLLKGKHNTSTNYKKDLKEIEITTMSLTSRVVVSHVEPEYCGYDIIIGDRR